MGLSSWLRGRLQNSAMESRRFKNRTSLRVFSTVQELEVRAILSAVMQTGISEPKSNSSDAAASVGSPQASGNVVQNVGNVPSTTPGADSFVLTYSLTNVSVTRSINGGVPGAPTVFGLTTPITLNGLESQDSVRIVGTDQNDLLSVGATSLTINTSQLILNGPASRTIAGGLGDDNYVFDSDTLLGSYTLEDSGGSADTLNMSSTTMAVSVNLGLSSLQVVNPHLSLRLTSVNAFENLIGGDGNDNLRGNGRANVLSGNGGNDTLNGAAGDDQLFGSLGDDTYAFSNPTAAESDSVTEVAGEGTDTLSFQNVTSDVSLSLVMSPAEQQSVHANRTLAISDGAQFENLVGGSGNDRLRGNAQSNELFGTAGNDTLVGAEGNDKLVGGPGDDSYIFASAASLENDSVSELSNGGVDTLSFQTITSDITLTLTAGMFQQQQVHTNRMLKIRNALEIESVVGGSGNDSLRGNAQPNTLFGTSGNDTLVGAGGDDKLYGGRGDDTYIFSNATAAESDSVSEEPGSGVDTLSFEQVTADIKLTLGMPAFQQQLLHTDRILRILYASEIENVIGGSGNDTLRGNAKSNLLYGTGGNDTLVGAGGNDQLYGGQGDDTYGFANATSPELDTVSEEPNAGLDTLSFSLATDNVNVTLGSGPSQKQQVQPNRMLEILDSSEIENLVGGSGNDWLTGNSKANQLFGTAGNDTLAGSGGSDKLYGGQGDDNYWFANATASESDSVSEQPNSGLDTLNFSMVTTSVTMNLGAAPYQQQPVHSNRMLQILDAADIESVFGGSGNDYLTGNARANQLNGNSGNDVLVGNGENDKLWGGAGRDIIVGGAGADSLFGGAGDDILIAGFFSTENRPDRLNDLRTAWIDNSDFLTRVTTLRSSVGPSGATLQVNTTVFDDADSLDVLTGDADLDWFFSAADDSFTDLAFAEVLDFL
jgi:Ca2+-binding RTX toxin-like protein